MLRRSSEGRSYGFFFAMALCLSAYLLPTSAAPSETIHKMCTHAYDRDSCVSSLAAHPEAATSGPRGLATIGINNAIFSVSSFYSYTTSLRSTSNGAGEDSALAVCQNILLDAQDNMQLSLGTLAVLNPLKFKDQMADTLTWLSSALTDHTTCLDGVSEKAGTTNVALMNSKAVGVTTLLSNAVSLVAAISNFGVNGDHSRRLLRDDSDVYELGKDELPVWMRPAERKLMQTVTNNLTIVDAVVAQDGSGQYQSIQAAINAAPQNNARKWVIRVKTGVYNEYVEVPKTAKNLVMFGDGMGKTVITGSKSVVGSNVTTFLTATMAVLAPSFLGRDFTVRNTAGAVNHQAVALKVQGDKSAFWRVALEGYQDTLYAHSNRQFFKDCTISGTVDFVFGNAAAVFQSCTLLARLPMPGQQNTFTAQGRTISSQNTGLSFQNCLVDAAPELKNQGSQVVLSYLGRPWKEYSRTVFLTCAVTDVVAPAGWLPWNGDFALKTLFYGEYKNAGSGSAGAGRVTWATQIQDANVANQFTVNPFLMGAEWLPQTAIVYSAALPTPIKQGTLLELGGSRAGFLRQCFTLTRRSYVNMSRDTGYYWLRLLMLTVCIGSIYFNVGSEFSAIMGRAGCMSYVTGFLTFMSIGGFPSFVEDMKVFTRERLNGHYGVAAFVIGNSLSSLPFLFLISVVSGVIVYFMVQLRVLHWLSYV